MAWWEGGLVNLKGKLSVTVVSTLSLKEKKKSGNYTQDKEREINSFNIF